MTAKERIAVLLEENRSRYISGEEMAERLGVSRAAVWKAIGLLKENGYQIDAVTGKGYCLSEDTDVLSVSGIKNHLQPSLQNFEIDVYKEVTSTNTLLRQKAADGAAEGTTVIAQRQTGGKGRFGRSFFSPEDSGLYMSILLRPNLTAAEATLITAAAAVAVCEAIETTVGGNPQIKWVNDVYLNEKKVCGILSEGNYSMESGQLEYVILGIGINVYEPTGGFPKELAEIAGALSEKQQGGLKNRLAAGITQNVMNHYARLSARGFLIEYRRRCFVTGQRITIKKNGENIPALALGVDDDCKLCVRYDDGAEEALFSGEVSTRLDPSDNNGLT